MAIKEYKLPNDGARPRRLALSDDDTIWYTDFARGMLGRLDLKTGDVKEWPSPSGPKSEPYGIVFTKGALWYNQIRRQAEHHRATSIPDRRNSKAGRSPAAATLCATWTSRRTAIRSPPTVWPTRSGW